MKFTKSLILLFCVMLVVSLSIACNDTEDVSDGDTDNPSDGDEEATDGDTDATEDEQSPDGDDDAEEEFDSTDPVMAVTTTAHLRLVPTIDSHGSECIGFEDNDFCQNPGMLMPDIDIFLDHGLGVWTVEEGEAFSLNEELGFERGEVAEDQRRSLFVWAHMSDVHITDEESPNRMAAFDSKTIPSALRPMDMYSEVVLNSAVKTINAFNASNPIDAVVVSGDMTDNAQFNEMDNFIKIMSGGEVNPDSGDDDDPVGGPNNDPQDIFTAPGLDMPWIIGMGNHDTLILGNWEINEETITQGIGESAITGTRNGETYEVESGYITADADRTPIDHEEMINMFFNDDSLPEGHGLTQDNLDNNRAYYTWDPSEDSIVRFITLDTAFRPQGFEGQGMGSSYVSPVIDLEQYNDFLIPALEQAKADKKLVIIVNHHPSQKLQDDNLPERFITTEQLQNTLKSYSNVLIHCVGHSHENTAWPRVKDDEDGGYFEVQSSSLIDWPQQMRFYELVDNGNDTLSLFTVIVDHQSESQDSMSEYSRMLALIDVQTHWGEGGPGISIERNVEMVFEVPDGFADMVANAEGRKVQALTSWIGEHE